MKKSILKHALLFIAMLISFGLSAQTIVFQYDNSGNRISRDIVVLKSTTNNDSETKQVINQGDILGDAVITISPNPNGGRFTVKIDASDLETSYQMQLYSIDGKLVYENKSKNMMSEIDISNQENGTYILSLIIGETRKTWKIIKQ